MPHKHICLACFFMLMFPILCLASVGDYSNLVINEIMYKPASGNANEQFIELYNRGNKPIDLSGCRFSQAVKFSFPMNTILSGKQYLVLAKDAATIKRKYGISNVIGNFSGQLNDYHDTLIFYSPSGKFIFQISYGSDSGWPTEPKGKGPSLELISPLAAPDTRFNWSASKRPGGTPGRQNSTFTQTPKLKISRGPYLTWQHNPASTMTINFSSTLATKGIVQYGKTKSLNMSIVDDKATIFHVAELCQLTPNTRYFYRVKVGNDCSPIYSFKTAPTDNSSVTFVVYGDNKQGDNIHKTFAKMMLKENPNFIVYVGDMVSDGAGWVQYDAHMLESAKELIARVPIMPAIGDHEHNVRYGSHNRVAGDRYWHRLFALPGNGFNYSFDVGAGHFVALHYAELYQYGKVLKWLERDLANSTKQWKFIYFHRPPYSSARKKGSNKNYSDVKMRRMCCPIFEKYSVDMTFAGHIHTYERSLVNGVYYIVSGGGGGGLSSGHFIPPYPKWSLAHQREYHFVKVTFTAKTLTLQAIGLNGKVFDTMTVGKN